jgi:hypothetical protein
MSGSLASNAFKNNMGPRGIPVANRVVAAEERRWRNAAHQTALDEINNRGKVGPDRYGSPHHQTHLEPSFVSELSSYDVAMNIAKP